MSAGSPASLASDAWLPNLSLTMSSLSAVDRVVTLLPSRRLNWGSRWVLYQLGRIRMVGIRVAEHGNVLTDLCCSDRLYRKARCSRWYLLERWLHPVQGNVGVTLPSLPSDRPHLTSIASDFAGSTTPTSTTRSYTTLPTVALMVRIASHGPRNPFSPSSHVPSQSR
jgi:hypothetical protein